MKYSFIVYSHLCAFLPDMYVERKSFDVKVVSGKQQIALT